MNDEKKFLQSILPPFKGDKVLIVQHQGTRDIINEIVRTHEMYVQDYNLVYGVFDRADVMATSRAIWEFLKYNLKYKAESADDQSVKSPSAIIADGHYVDCKHYSLFIGGCLDAMKMNEGDDYDWAYRFVSDSPSKQICHVFVVVFDGDREIWVDPVLGSFNQRKSWTAVKDKYMPPVAVNGLSRITGTDSSPAQRTVTVDGSAAERAFLVMVNLNLFSLKDLLKSDLATLEGKVQPYMDAHGFDYNQLMAILNG
jgi:hypothetical protein